MAFIKDRRGIVLSFATVDDVRERDQRLFEANEGLTETVVEDALLKATARILTQIRATDWWKNYYITQAKTTRGFITPNGYITVPEVDTTKIRARYQEFTDICVYLCLWDYLLPRIADFGSADSAERQKLDFYNAKYRNLFEELVNDGDWYDFDGSGSVTLQEKMPTNSSPRRIR